MKILVTLDFHPADDVDFADVILEIASQVDDFAQSIHNTGKTQTIQAWWEEVVE